MSCLPVPVRAAPAVAGLASCAAAAGDVPPTDREIVVTATRVPRRSTRCSPRSSSSTARRSSAARPATPPTCCASTRGSTSAATAGPARRPPCSSAAPRATTRWCWWTACASIRARSASRRCRTSRRSMIERIEVVKGPRSALYGTDAIGGVINVDHAPRLARRLVRRGRLRRLRHPPGEPQRRRGARRAR